MMQRHDLVAALGYSLLRCQATTPTFSNVVQAMETSGRINGYKYVRYCTVSASSSGTSVLGPSGCVVI